MHQGSARRGNRRVAFAPERSALWPLLLVGCAACAHDSASGTGSAGRPGIAPIDRDPGQAASAEPPGPPPAPPPIALTIEHFDAEASARARSGDFVKCGQRYLDVYHAAPRSANAALALRNSMDCFRAGNAVGAAITSARLLIARFPRSKHAGLALLAVAELSSAIAYFGPAASAYEDYSRKHPKEDRARQGLLRAIRFRRSLGQHERAIADAERFVALYRTTHTAQAAQVALDAVASFRALGEQDRLIEHLRTYLQEIGSSAGVDRAIVARSALGVALWRKSCGVAPIDGLCAVRRRQENAAVAPDNASPDAAAATPPLRCTSDPQPVLVAVARDADLTARAEKHFRAVIDELWRGGAAARELQAEAGERDARLERMIEAVAEAKLHLAEPAYEAFLGFAQPTGLSTARNQTQAMRALTRWLGTFEPRLDRAVAAYRGAMHLEGWTARWPIGAAARTGDLYLRAARTLTSAPVPGFVTARAGAGKLSESYCSALEQRLRHLYVEAEKAFELCRAEGIRRKQLDSAAKACAGELVRMRPDRFPPVRELHTAATRTGVTGDEYKLGRRVWSHRLSKDAASVEAHYNLAWIAYDELASATDSAAQRALVAEAERHLSSALALDHDRVDAWLLYGLLYLRSVLLGVEDSANRLDLAELLLREALERRPEHALAWNALGLVEIARRRPGPAAQMFQRATAADAKLRVALLNAGDLALENRDFEGARDSFRALLLLQPGSYEGRIGYGVALRALGDYEAAEDAYLTAQKYSPKDARGEASFDLGILYAAFLAPAEKDASAAIARYRKARDQFKRHLEARNATPEQKREATSWIATCDERIRALGAP